MTLRFKKIDRSRLMWLLLVIYLASTCLTSTDANGRYLLLGVVILLFGIHAFTQKGAFRLSIGPFHGFLLLWALYCLLSSLWAWVPSDAVSKARTIFEAVVLTSVMYLCFQDKSNVWNLYNVIRWAGFLISLYTIVTYGIGAMVLLLSSGKRIELSFSNINTVGINASLAIVITIFEAFFRKKDIISLLLCVPSALVVAASGTRKAILIILIGIALILLFKYWDKNALKTLTRLLPICLLALVLVSFVLSLPAFSGIMKRMDGFFALLTGEGRIDMSTNYRTLFTDIGLSQFLKTPFFGIGIGSSGKLLYQTAGMNTYMHNNMVELLCCGGIVGFLIYYSIYAYCLWKLFMYHSCGDPTAKLGIILLLILLITDLARVSYYSKSTIFYFMVFFLHIRSLEKRRFTQ